MLCYQQILLQKVLFLIENVYLCALELEYVDATNISVGIAGARSRRIEQTSCRWA